jgi:predicted small metal-binding protein
MRNFHCSDAGMNCDYVARGATDGEVLDDAFRHGRDVHGLSRSDELESRVRGLIREDRSEDEAHDAAAGAPPSDERATMRAATDDELEDRCLGCIDDDEPGFHRGSMGGMIP